MAQNIPGVPTQLVGGSHQNIADKCYDNINEASLNYAILRNRLIDINAWHTYVGNWSAKFTHLDQGLNRVHRLPKAGDYIKIDLPGVGNQAGDGYDWVQIKTVDLDPYEDDERLLFSCVPSINPKSEYAEDVAHFILAKQVPILLLAVKPIV